MSDFVAALGLVCVIEGLMFAAAPGAAKKAASNMIATPEGTLRGLGVAAAALGLLIVWLVRG
ncbi:DUF2065 domain-containing protein [Hansschlegelia sp. KR7-227]|jgi:uncharacterized protein YjeT (DUF2065 family)|uniref:DUF2065 domain-containing protein n=1 Tax=Hansschlegelia sp. KR7-227 TaxID=3400914 RepID=UPI003C06F2C5